MKRAALALALVAVGCSAEPRTEVVVIVRSDMPATAVQSARIVVENAANRDGAPLYQSGCVCVGDPPCTPLPLTLGLLADHHTSDPFTVRATGYGDAACGTVAVEQSATVAFVTDETLALELMLSSACAGVACSAGTTCVDASQACVDDRRGNLPVYSPGLLDEGTARPTDGGADAGDDAGSDMAPTPPDMTSTTPTVPSIRTNPALAYDVQRARTVMFGGLDNSGVELAETWEWDGTAWHLQHPNGAPLARDTMAVAYDSTRHRVVVYGGGGGAVYDDTWAWDGTTWTLLASTGPGARYATAMAYDAARDRMVLFGGYPALPDTWEFDGTSWSAKANSGPAGRQMPALAYDPVRQVTVLFGGKDMSGVALGDVWEWSGTSWTQSMAAAPAARFGHKLAWDSARQRILLEGGINETDTWQPGIWAWNGSAWTSLSPTGGPPGRVSFGFTFDSARARAVLFGGFYAGDNYGDTWEWDSSLNLWQQR